MGDKSPRSKDKNKKQKQAATKKSDEAKARKQASPVPAFKSGK